MLRRSILPDHFDLDYSTNQIRFRIKFNKMNLSTPKRVLKSDSRIPQQISDCSCRQLVYNVYLRNDFEGWNRWECEGVVTAVGPDKNQRITKHSYYGRRIYLFCPRMLEDACKGFDWLILCLEKLNDKMENHEKISLAKLLGATFLILWRWITG